MESVDRSSVSKPLVTIIIPVKNGERYLTAAIQSVLDQDYSPFELIVVDGQSNDRTAQIAKSFPRVHYLSQSGDPGIAAARNLGIAAAEGELIAFISHDDLWAKNKLSVQVEHMLAHPEIMYTITRVKFFLEPGCVCPPGFREELLEGDHVGVMPETLVARKSLFDQIGGFNPEFVIGEDNDWFVRAKDKHVPSAVIPRALTYKRIHDSNISFARINAETLDRDMLKIAKQSIDRKRGLSDRGGRES
ncbi:MAG TPA: glycosyltransferase [Anaerolineae bacterium]